MGYRFKKKIINAVFLFIIVATCILCAPTKTYASNGIMISDDLDNLDGDGKYVGSKYRNNYQLDVEKLGVTEVADKVLNALANIVFSVISFLGFATVAVFYHALSFDLAALLQPQIDGIQLALHDSLFMPLLQLALIGAMILAITKYARRDISGLLGQLGKVIFIIVLSLLVVKDSATLLSYATSITKSVSVSILTGISGVDVESSINNYSAEAAGILWVSLVHEPWKSLEFGAYEYTEEDVEFFLTTSSEKERKKHVKKMMDGDSGPFSKDRSATRIGQGLIILITMTVKCLVYILVAVMYIVFQLIAVFFVIMAPLILLLSLIPGYDFQILGVWARKIIETQIGVLIITFLMGVMIMIDGLLHNLANEMGWFVVLILQIGASLGLYAFRWQIFSAFNSAQRGIQNPNLMKRQLIRSGNPYSGFEKLYMYKQVQSAMGYKRNRLPEREFTTQGWQPDESERQGQRRQDSDWKDYYNNYYNQSQQNDQMGDAGRRDQQKDDQSRSDGQMGGTGRRDRQKGGQSRSDSQMGGTGRRDRQMGGQSQSGWQMNGQDGQMGNAGRRDRQMSEQSRSDGQMGSASRRDRQMGAQSQQDARQGDTGRRNRMGSSSRQDRQMSSSGPANMQSQQNNQIGGQNQQQLEDSEIKEEFFYPPRAVTDNWHDIWNSAEPVKRPYTTDRSRRSMRRPILTEAEMGLQGPQMARPAIENDRVQQKSQTQDNGPKMANYMKKEDEVIKNQNDITRPVTTQRKAVPIAQQPEKEYKPEPIQSNISYQDDFQPKQTGVGNAAILNQSIADQLKEAEKEYKPTTRETEFGDSGSGSAEKKITQSRSITEIGSIAGKIDRDVKNYVPQDKSESHNHDAIKRPSLDQTPEHEAKPMVQLSERPQIKRPISGNNSESKLKMQAKVRQTEKIPLKASRIHSDGFKINR